VLRAAGWPIEVVDAFAARELALLASALMAAERSVIDRKDDVLGALHASVPTIPNRPARAYVLAIQRRIHATSEPLPVPPPGVQATLIEHPAVAALIADEAALRAALAEQRVRFERAYDLEMDRQVAVLRSQVDSPRFGKALLIANRTVAEAWRADAQRRPKRQRHLQNTVFLYLMRACGRSTPNGAWAGVAPVMPAPAGPATPGLRVADAPPRYEATLNLRPFVLMLRALAGAPRYRWEQPLHLNPTLRASGSGWRYEQDQGGIHRWVSLPGQPLLTAIIDAYADDARLPARPLVETLAALWPGQPALRSGLERLIDWLIDRDVLRTDVRLPSTASTVWSALAKVCEHLLPPDRQCWTETIARLQRLCEHLGTGFEELSIDEVEQLLATLEAEVQQLWNAAGLPGEPPAPLLYVDMRAPFSVTWSAAAIESATKAVAATLAFHAADGGAELFRRQSLADVFAALADGQSNAAPLLDVIERLDWRVPPLPRQSDAVEYSDTLEFILGQSPPDSALGREAAEYCRVWQHRLAAVHTRPTWTLPDRALRADVQPGARGSILLRLAGDERVWIGAGRPEAALFAARFATVLQDGTGEAPLIAALREQMDAAAVGRIAPVEVVGWDAFTPNVALHPLLAAQVLDVHQSACQLRDLWLISDPERQRVWLRRRSEPGLLAPLYSTGADLGYHDVCGRLLQVLAAGHGWEFLSFEMPALQAERTTWRHLPRLVLGGGEVLRPERWTIDRQTVERLAAASGAARYRLWREEMTRRGVPDLVHVRRGPHAPELLMRTDSPLAVRSLLESEASRVPWIEMMELPGMPESWPVRDAKGNHYVAELAVSWFDDEYWQTVAPSDEVIGHA
jgi:hypothetical protein